MYQMRTETPTIDWKVKLDKQTTATTRYVIRTKTKKTARTNTQRLKRLCLPLVFANQVLELTIRRHLTERSRDDEPGLVVLHLRDHTEPPPELITTLPTLWQQRSFFLSSYDWLLWSKFDG